MILVVAETALGAFALWPQQTLSWWVSWLTEWSLKLILLFCKIQPVTKETINSMKNEFYWSKCRNFGRLLIFLIRFDKRRLSRSSESISVSCSGARAPVKFLYAPRRCSITAPSGSSFQLSISAVHWISLHGFINFVGMWVFDRLEIKMEYLANLTGIKLLDLLDAALLLSNESRGIVSFTEV